MGIGLVAMPDTRKQEEAMSGSHIERFGLGRFKNTFSVRYVHHVIAIQYPALVPGETMIRRMYLIMGVLFIFPDLVVTDRGDVKSPFFFRLTNVKILLNIFHRLKILM